MNLNDTLSQLFNKSIDTQKKVPALNPLQNIDKKQAERLEKAGYDVNMIAKIQPLGGITFDDDHAIAGDGYSACLSVVAYPTNPNYFFGIDLTTSDHTATVIDVKSIVPETIKGTIDRSLQELGDRTENGRHATDRNDSQNEYSDLINYAAQLSNGEIAKRFVTRIFVYSETIESLQEKITNIRQYLKGLGYRSTVYNFIQPQQYKAIFKPLSEQEKEFVGVPIQDVPAFTLGAGFPFSAQSLNDPHGLPLGRTTAGGLFSFDQFRSTAERQDFNMLVLGKMGAGKSTLLKMLSQGSFARGMMWRGIDKTKEYVDLVKANGGVVVSLDGSEGMINPLEVTATNIDPVTNEVDEVASFMQHLSKVSILFRMVNRDFKEIEMQDFQTLLRDFYITRGMLPEDWNRNPHKVHITGLDPQAYPTLSEFTNFVSQICTPEYLDRINAQPERRRTFEKIYIGLESMIRNYGQIFDGHSTLRDLTDERIVIFDTSAISTMSRSVYQAQVYTALSLIWNHALINGRRQTALLESGKIDPIDIRFFNVVLDECHNIINSTNLFAVEYIKNFQREMRKFFAGIIFATQSPEEMVPDHTQNAEEDNLKVIFQLCQYKVTMLMDPSQINKMRGLLGDALTSADYKSIPNLKRGYGIVSTGGTDSRYKVHFEPTKEQLKLFKGGR